MKIIIRLILLFLAVSSVAQAQNLINNIGQPVLRSFVNLSGGLASPMGNFASSDGESASSGFAKMGTHFALEGAYYFHPNIGIGGVFSTSSFSLNTTELAARYLESFDCDSALAKAGQYHTVSFLVGPYFALPLNRLTIEARLLGGITNTTTPDIIGTAINEYNGPNEGSTSTFVQTSATANAFGFLAGLGLRYCLSMHLLLSLRGDYFYSKPELSLDNIGRNNVSGIVLDKYDEPVSGINASLGIGYQF